MITPAGRAAARRARAAGHGRAPVRLQRRATPRNVHDVANHREHRIAYTGTHDNDTLRGWYESLPDGDPGAGRRGAAARGARGLVGPDRADVLLARAGRDGAGAGRARARHRGADEPAGQHGRARGSGGWRRCRRPDLARRLRAATEAAGRAAGSRVDSSASAAWPPLQTRRARPRPACRRDPRRQPPLPRRGGGRLRRQVGRRLRRGRARAGARQGARSCSARDPGPFARSLEIGAGTGYFSLNLMQAGVVALGGLHRRLARACSRRSSANAERLGLEVETVACDAAALPFDDGAFDLVLGHAVLHHLPELERAFAEFLRVLRPGGVLLFAGEPSRHGDRIAAVPKRAGRWRPRRCGGGWSAPGAGDGQAAGGGARRPRARVDGRRPRLHAGRPRAPRARAPGFDDVRVRGEELLANWFGWFNRTRRGDARSTTTSRTAGSATPTAATSLLQKVDRALLEPHLPRGGLLQPHARRPQAAQRLSRWKRRTDSGRNTATISEPARRPPERARARRPTTPRASPDCRTGRASR